MAGPVAFDPEHPLPGLDGFSPAFVADLYDFASNYGADVRGVEGLRRIGIPTPRPAQVTVTVPPSKHRNMTVRPVPADGDVSMVCILLLDDDEHSFVMWDRRCTVEDVRRAMAVVDAEMSSCRDPATGRRLRVVSDLYAPPPLAFDLVFGRKGMVVVLDEGADPEAARHQFDRPDEVAVVPDAGGRGRHGLCRKADLGLVARRDAIVARALARHGLRTREEFGRLPEDARRRLLAEIQAEFDAEEG
ncbi:MAG: hypothetical protein RL272_785 [Candidatus Parcubacteria bacterium]|jgi:hypothetical protein